MYPLPLQNAYMYPNYRYGDLDGISCTLEEYLQLPCGGEDSYELVNNSLRWRKKMGDAEHERIREGVVELLRKSIRDDRLEDQYSVFPEKSLYVNASKKSGQSLRGSRASICYADVLVQHRGLESKHQNLSPKSKKIGAPRGYPPVLVVEITSHNADTDLYDKWEEYMETGVEEYVIIDRAMKKKNEPRVIVGRLRRTRSGGYSETIYTGLEKVQALFLNTYTANQLLNPPPATNTASSPIKKVRTQTAEIKKNDAEKALLKQQLKEQDKKNDAEKALLKQQLKEQDAIIADLKRKIPSSSGPASSTRNNAKHNDKGRKSGKGESSTDTGKGGEGGGRGSDNQTTLRKKGHAGRNTGKRR